MSWRRFVRQRLLELIGADAIIKAEELTKKEQAEILAKISETDDEGR
jgi:hypothetical protein